MNTFVHPGSLGLDRRRLPHPGGPGEPPKGAGERKKAITHAFNGLIHEAAAGKIVHLNQTTEGEEERKGIFVGSAGGKEEVGKTS